MKALLRAALFFLPAKLLSYRGACRVDVAHGTFMLCDLRNWECCTHPCFARCRGHHIRAQRPALRSAWLKRTSTCDV